MKYAIYADECGYPSEQIQAIVALCVSPAIATKLRAGLDEILIHHDIKELKWSRVRTNNNHMQAVMSAIEFFFSLHMAYTHELFYVSTVYDSTILSIDTAYTSLLNELTNENHTYELFPDQNNVLKRAKPEQKIVLPDEVEELSVEQSHKEPLIQMCDLLAGMLREEHIHADEYRDMNRQVDDLAKPLRYRYQCIQMLRRYTA